MTQSSTATQSTKEIAGDLEKMLGEKIDDFLSLSKKAISFNDQDQSKTVSGTSESQLKGIVV